VELGQVWVVEPRQAGDIPWSLEKLLRSGCCGMALAWPRRLADHQVRRLQLAAEAGGGLGVLIGQSAAGAGYAALRIEANPAPQGLAVDILKARGSLRRASVIVTP
jgi:cell division inhibitor SulA/protein ImuA